MKRHLLFEIVLCLGMVGSPTLLAVAGAVPTLTFEAPTYEAGPLPGQDQWTTVAYESERIGSGHPPD